MTYGDAIWHQGQLEKRVKELEEEAGEWKAAAETWANTRAEMAQAWQAAEARSMELEDALREIADTNMVYPPHDPGNYMPPKGRDGPYRRIALAVLSTRHSGQPQVKSADPSEAEGT